jgi:hypothetical protein
VVNHPTSDGLAGDPEGSGLPPWAFANCGGGLVYPDAATPAQLSPVNGERERAASRGLHRPYADREAHRHPNLLGLAHGASVGLERARSGVAFVAKTMSSGIGERAPRPVGEYARVHRGEHAPDELLFRAERGMGLCLQFVGDELEQSGACLRVRAWRGRPRFGRASARAARSGLPCRGWEAARRGAAHEMGDSRRAAGKGFPV